MKAATNPSRGSRCTTPAPPTWGASSIRSIRGVKAQGGPPPAGPGGGPSNVDASVTIWADVATNALIITAPPKIMKSLMAVIDKLDIRRAQVQVEAVIVQLDVNKSANLGVQWILDGGNSYGYGVTNLPGQGTSIVNLAAAVLGVTGGTTPTGTTGSTGTTGPR